MPRCLTIAASDSGGGAGIQADLKAFARLGCYGTSAIVALTAQNTVEVAAVHEAPTEFIRAELDAIFMDIGVDAADDGECFLPSDRRDGRRYLERTPLPLVVDPVLVAHGARSAFHDAAAKP